MKSFKNFVLTEARGKLTGSGQVGDEHIKKYIEPHIGSEDYTHTLAKDHEGLSAGSKVKLRGVFKYLNGKTHVTATDEEGGKHIIPVSKLNKPGEYEPNKGQTYENDFVERMKLHGIMPNHLNGAGSTSGKDFAIENRKTKQYHTGSVSGNLLTGEAKGDAIKAAMGQLTIHHKDDIGWHIPDRAKKEQPLLAKEIEKAGVLDHMNKYHKNIKKVKTTESGRVQAIRIKHPNLDPAKAYLKDSKVDVLQVKGYGAYSGGDKDVTGHGLPTISGKGEFEVREKQKYNRRARTVAFHVDGVKGLNKSHVDLDNDDHLFSFKKSLGFKD
jgi:hypothetical protein